MINYYLDYTLNRITLMNIYSSQVWLKVLIQSNDDMSISNLVYHLDCHRFQGCSNSYLS